MSIDSVTEKYNFNESDIDISSDFSQEPVQSYSKSIIIESKIQESEPIELFEDTETDKKKFFEALGTTDYKELMDQLSESEDIDTSEILRGIDVGKEDDYSMSFDSVTDLKQVKYDSKYEFETDLMTGMSIISEADAINNVTHAGDDMKVEEKVKIDSPDSGTGNNTEAVKDAIVVDKAPVQPDLNTADATASTLIADSVIEVKPALETSSESVDKNHEVEPKVEPKPEPKMIVVKQPSLNAKPVDTAPYLTFADLMKLNQEEASSKKPVVKKDAVKINQASPVRKRSESPVRKSPQKKEPIKQDSPAKKPAESPVRKSPQKASSINPSKPKDTPNTKKLLLRRASSKFAGQEQSSSRTSSPSKSPVPNVQISSASPVPSRIEISEKEKLLEDQLIQYQTEVNKLMRDLKIAETAQVETAAEKEQLTKSLAEKDQEILSFQKQVEYLETALTIEKTTKSKPSGPMLSVEESETIRKEISDQEYLIRGYQTENEKLVAQIKELKSVITDNEQRNLMKLEQYTRENQSLRNQIEVLEPQVGKDFTTTANQVKMEQLTEKIRDLEHQSRIQAEEAIMMQRKFEAQLQDREKQLELVRDANPEQLKQLKLDYQNQTEQYKAYILEIETKLEWYIENQDIANDIQRRIERYEKAILELSSLNTGKSKTRSNSDIKRISVLENQLKDLQEDSKLGQKTPSLNLNVTRPSITPEDTLKFLKQRIHSLEGENTKLQNELGRKIKELELELLNHKNSSEKMLQQKEVDFEKHRMQLQAERDILKESNKVLELQLSKYREDLSMLSKDGLAAEVSSEQFQKVQMQEVGLKKRIREMEVQMQKRTAQFGEWEKVKSKMVDELQSQMVALKRENDSLEQQLQNSQSLRNAQAKSELQIQLQTTQVALESALSKASTLEMRLEMQETARKTIQQTTLDLLKETQRESSKMAFTHTQKSIDLLRQEWKREHDLILEQKSKEYKHQIQKFQQQLQTDGLDQLKKQMYLLQVDYDNLKKEHQDCLERLEMLKNGASPSTAEFDRLSLKIKQLESRQSQSEIAKELTVIKRERDDLKSSLKARDGRIREFEREVQSLLDGILAMKQEIQYL